ncbi:MAG: SDR family oxidoreductase [Haloferacaceae archaeon]
MALDGRTALVTGASSGIGEAVVRELAAAGADVALLARREERLRSIADELREEYDCHTHVRAADVRDEATVEAAVEEVVDAFGGLDVVVSNAGLGRGAGVADLDTEAYDAMVGTNVDGCFYLARAALPHLRASAGNLVFVGSFAGQYPRPANPVYAATKWWVRGFALSLQAREADRVERPGDAVAVSTVNPTEVRTEFGGQDGEPFAERFEPGEALEPAEVAAAVVFTAQQERAVVPEVDVHRRDKFKGW